ncbi:hypothetical protein [Desulfarculus baarsii]|uniref:hypothetical protein n=1 Tax=Desulfarculus baarsii TaxID=453230 RepID=UPI0011D0370E|nr:hypothetical protein [Desulfarculus baarsii]
MLAGGPADANSQGNGSPWRRSTLPPPGGVARNNPPAAKEFEHTMMAKDILNEKHENPPLPTESARMVEANGNKLNPGGLDLARQIEAAAR